MSQHVKITGKTPSAVAWIANDPSGEGGFAVLVRRRNDFLLASSTRITKRLGSIRDG